MSTETPSGTVVCSGEGRNPVLPEVFSIPDPEAHVVGDGRLFVYGSLDGPEDTYCSGVYRPVSTRDLRTWTVHDVGFRAEQAPWFGEPLVEAVPYPQKRTPFMIESARRMGPGMLIRSLWAMAFTRSRERFLYAPDAVAHGGRHYLFFCMTDGSEGVAVADVPEGPFRDPVRLPCTGIDPAVFADRDGAVYLYWGQWSAHGVRLDGDLRSFDQASVSRALLTEEEHGFHEGSSVRRIGDTYYFVFADMHRGKPTSLGYATSSSPLGPFRYRGIIVDSDGCDPEAWNNHGSIEEVDGRHYVFYHRSSRGTRYHRRLCIEPIEILPDGSIPEVPMTSQGVGDPFRPGEALPARSACVVGGRARIDVDEAGLEVLELPRTGDRAVFRYLAQGEFAGLTLDGSGAGTVRVLVDGRTIGIAAPGDDGVLRLATPFLVDGEGELVIEAVSSRSLRVRTLTLNG
ncbi:family 43 glycosylhydrolase [Microbacterium fluvii]|uniref:Family 43 glycosylhydrolase n=1 Tax=Microbacterium fluvii TaxID=415215 RepID=A0ABW2HDU3_9MICO|nr:family 43 glycosylhydrolase [Microbacterium fluvii]MCU4673046.1 family 43 glycosylhydrolase [Microbacterium fluvii]